MSGTIGHLHLSDLTALVVTSQDGESLGEPDFQSDEQSHCLYGVISSVDVVTHEEVVRLRRLATDLEEL